VQFSVNLLEFTIDDSLVTDSMDLLSYGVRSAPLHVAILQRHRMIIYTLLNIVASIIAGILAGRATLDWI
jgi:hypothetical protein